ncbi:MAG: DUF5666 domain-containing protein [Candidatus Korobacteraceae bacterium]
MNTAILKNVVLVAGLTLAVTGFSVAQQDAGPIRGNAGQASQPSGTGVPGPSTPTATPPSSTGTSNRASATTPAPPVTTTPQTDPSTPQSDEPRTVLNTNSADPNANDPLLEPPPLPKTKPTLIGGTAARVDHIRNRLIIQPFGGGRKIKVFVDERTHIYRDGEATTVLGIRKGDRVYADTMLDGARVFAKNVRVENQVGMAEVRGQVTAANPEKGTVTVRDELSSQPVTVAVGSGTQYSAYKGPANSNDLQPGSLVDVQFARSKEKQDVAQEVILLAKPGDTYVFTGVVTNIDLRTNTLDLENRSDDQTYELHFDQSSVDDRSKLKVGSEVTAHAVFNGKQYNANDLQLQAANTENSDKTDKADKSKEQ